jgi:D-alanyl-D-alanine carboxypeptidase
MNDYEPETGVEDTPIPEAAPLEPQTRMPVVRQLSLLALVLLAVLSASMVPSIIAKFSPEHDMQTAAASEPSARESTDEHSDAFGDVSVRAKSALVVDTTTGDVLFAKDADEQLPIASITKLMTALVAYEIMETHAAVTVPAAAVAQDGNSGLAAGESFSFTTLADLTLMSSSNDGAFALAAAAGAALDADAPAQSFVEAMNVRAKELGLTETYFRNPTGLDISETEAGAYSSAHDIATLLTYILAHHPEILEATTEPDSVFYNSDGASHEAENTNYTVREIPGIIGSKTGYTTLAGGNLAVAFEPSVNRPIIVVALGSTYTGRFDDVLALVHAATTAVQ